MKKINFSKKYWKAVRIRKELSEDKSLIALCIFLLLTALFYDLETTYNLPFVTISRLCSGITLGLFVWILGNFITILICSHIIKKERSKLNV